jgi:peptide/nickel transport system substrate-binding protein
MMSFGGGMGMGLIYPHEWVDADPSDWHNAVGSGPYILTDYVAGSGATYTRNPNFWGKTTINGKDYQLPFTETLIQPIIADASTQVAALRVGKIDWAPYVTSQYQSTLAQSSSDLIINKYLSGTIRMWEMNRISSTYFSKKAIRQAMMIGTDIKTISSVIYNTDVWYSYPFAPGTLPFTPLDKLPAAQQALWTYDAAKAKQMISDAGYPNGFTFNVDITSADTDVAEACAAMWAKIGVTAKINVNDTTTQSSLFSNVTYKDMLINGWTMVSPVTALNLARSGNPGNMYAPGDPLGFEQQFETLDSTIDSTARTALEVKLGLALLDDVTLIPFGSPYQLNCYWPWVKNYYGEIEAGYNCQIPMIERIWVDHNLKTSLGK